MRTSGSNWSASAGSMGTQTRPVLGCTQKGALSKWFMCLDTSMSRRGNVYAKTISCWVQRMPAMSIVAEEGFERETHQRLPQHGSLERALSLLGCAFNFALQQGPPCHSLIASRRADALVRL